VHEIPGLRLSVPFQLSIFGPGLLQPELPGEIPATRDRRDSRAGLRRDARDVSASFVLHQRIERLELEARRLSGLTGDGPAAAASRKQIVNDVGTLRRDGEMKSYIDLLFLALVIVLCISKIVTA
jgi:hypothetical protein